MAGGILSVLGHGLALKELLDQITNFLKTNKDNPLLRALIEKFARNLREEILTLEATKLLKGDHKKRIEAFFSYLKNEGRSGDLQAIRNTVLTYLIFENAEVPLTQAPPSSEATSGNDVFKLKITSTPPASGEKCLSFTFAIEFLNDIASHIKRKGSGYDFQPAINRLKDYGFIDQMDKTWWMNIVGKTNVEILEQLKKLQDGGLIGPQIGKLISKPFNLTAPGAGDMIAGVLDGWTAKLVKQNKKRRSLWTRIKSSIDLLLS